MFPLGIEPYLIGGILIGLGVSLIYILTGLHATQSSLLYHDALMVLEAAILPG